METGLQDLKISGSGEAAGGKYNNVRISGSGEIRGDVECNEYHASGASALIGNLIAKKVSTSGASDIKGNVTAEEIETSGASDISGDVKAKRIEISGASDIKGNLSAEYVEVHGASDVKGDCEAEYFEAHGGFDIGGLLNAEKIDIKVDGQCRVREIGCETINVRGTMGVSGSTTKFFKQILNHDDRLECSIIEGDNIHLENTTASIVRANNVEIGYGCEIGLIEYKESINISTESRVKEQRKWNNFSLK